MDASAGVAVSITRLVTLAAPIQGAALILAVGQLITSGDIDDGLAVVEAWVVHSDWHDGHQ